MTHEISPYQEVPDPELQGRQLFPGCRLPAAFFTLLFLLVQQRQKAVGHT